METYVYMPQVAGGAIVNSWYRYAESTSRDPEPTQNYWPLSSRNLGRTDDYGLSWRSPAIDDLQYSGMATSSGTQYKLNQSKRVSASSTDAADDDECEHRAKRTSGTQARATSTLTTTPTVEHQQVPSPHHRSRLPSSCETISPPVQQQHSVEIRRHIQSAVVRTDNTDASSFIIRGSEKPNTSSSCDLWQSHPASPKTFDVSPLRSSSSMFISQVDLIDLTITNPSSSSPEAVYPNVYNSSPDNSDTQRSRESTADSYQEEIAAFSTIRQTSSKVTSTVKKTVLLDTADSVQHSLAKKPRGRVKPRTSYLKHNYPNTEAVAVRNAENMMRLLQYDMEFPAELCEAMHETTKPSDTVNSKISSVSVGTNTTCPNCEIVQDVQCSENNQGSNVGLEHLPQRGHKRCGGTLADNGRRKVSRMATELTEQDDTNQRMLTNTDTGAGKSANNNRSDYDVNSYTSADSEDLIMEDIIQNDADDGLYAGMALNYMDTFGAWFMNTFGMSHGLAHRPKEASSLHADVSELITSMADVFRITRPGIR